MLENWLKTAVHLLRGIMLEIKVQLDTRVPLETRGRVYFFESSKLSFDCSFSHEEGFVIRICELHGVIHKRQGIVRLNVVTIENSFPTFNGFSLFSDLKWKVNSYDISKFLQNINYFDHFRYVLCVLVWPQWWSFSDVSQQGFDLIWLSQMFTIQMGCQKVPKSDIKSQFSMSKIRKKKSFESFWIFFFIEEYQFRSRYFVIDIF